MQSSNLASLHSYYNGEDDSDDEEYLDEIELGSEDEDDEEDEEEEEAPSKWWGFRFTTPIRPWSNYIHHRSPESKKARK